MGLSERKITTWTKPISSLAYRPQMSAAELKAAFDSNANEIKPKFNGLVDDLTGVGGASEIGASIEGVAGTNVQALLAALKALIDLRETTASADEKLSEKANQTTVNKTFKDISVNESTGVVTLTYVDGTTKAVNTSLSKIAVNFGFDAETQKITLMLNDGTTQHIDVSAFIKANEIVDSDNIVVTRNADGTVSLSVKSGSINAEMLTSTILDELKAYRDAAAISAQNAAASESNAQTYKNAAANFSQSAQDALNETIQHKNTAYRYAQDAATSKNAAEASATEAGQQAGSASGFAVRAEEALSKMGVHIGSGAPTNGAKLWLCPVNNPLVMNPDRATSDMTQEVGVNDKGKLVTKPTTSVEGGGSGTGAPGPAGEPGKSAYQYAVEGGYTGTEAEFSAKLAKEKFANPNALTFTGAVTGSYDGSAPVSVEIPSGVSEVQSGFELIDSIDWSTEGMAQAGAAKEYTLNGVTEIIIVWQGMANETQTASSLDVHLNDLTLNGCGNVPTSKASSTLYGFSYYRCFEGVGTVVIRSQGANAVNRVATNAQIPYSLFDITERISKLKISNRFGYVANTGITKIYVR